MGWVTLRHPHGGVPLSSNTPIWIAWKGTGEKVWLKYQEDAAFGRDFQRERGRWESKAIAPDQNAAWPATWPASDAGAFADYWYSCYLTFEHGL